ncbi:LuxR family transcriptional regulator [Bosea caraganae]|uniref:LuxR family transcriptional regulator n=1 Tax=Bosea caraganae TaxID=2763117 RepID=A0A370L7Y4_9HYPH|nr:PAS domain-containing protein [Bosea caraganae]RDJ25438.1 LuxR family transcriptional regulator [Bosea caraganae]RDJ25777.1 LuxR family transcriptional regulator [Bosea caraganae]
MARANLDAVVATIDSLLLSAYDAEQMPAAVEQIRQLFGGSKACFARVGPDLGPEDAVTTNFDPVMHQRAYEEFAEEFVSFGQTLNKVPIGQTYADHALIGEERLRASRVWREWMAPQDMYGGLGSRVLEAGPSFWFFDVQRGRNQDAFDAQDAALLERLTPIMTRVAELRRHIGFLTLQRDMARTALDTLSVGIVIADPQMRLVYANETADQFLAEPEGALGLRTGRIFARSAQDQAALKRLVAQTLAPAHDPNARRTHLQAHAAGAEGCNLSLCVLPVPPGYGLPSASPSVMIAIRPLEPAADLVAAAQQLFGLTETEAKFASALASGLSLAEAAEEQHVRISTARTHLARIFQKTGMRQQSQVAALLRGAELPVRSR